MILQHELDLVGCNECVHAGIFAPVPPTAIQEDITSTSDENEEVALVPEPGASMYNL